MEDRSIIKRIKPTNDKAKNENKRNEIKEGIKNCSTVSERFKLGKNDTRDANLDSRKVAEAKGNIFKGNKNIKELTEEINELNKNNGDLEKEKNKDKERAPATLEELIKMMNKREGVTARIATGDEEAYLKAVDAEGSHMMMEDGRSDIMFRKDVAKRWTALHEWMHRCMQKKNGEITPGEDKIIEDFLERYKGVFKIEK